MFSSEKFTVESIWFPLNNFDLNVRPTPSGRLFKGGPKGSIITLKETFQESECLCGTFKKASHRHDARKTRRGRLFIKRILRHD